MSNVASPITPPPTPENLEADKPSPQGLGVWFDVLAVFLGLIAAFVSAPSWRAVFASSDRTLFFGLTLAGLGIGLYRSKWVLGQLNPRTKTLWFGYGCGVLALLMGVLFSSPMWGCIAMSVVAAAWCWGRVRGEPLSRGVTVGAAILMPFALQLLADRGYFERLESLTISTTSLLADAINQPHAQADGQIMFKQGTADRFTTIGVWDSTVSIIGLSLFCAFAFRRGLIAGSIGIFLATSVWVACRSAAWLVLSYLSTSYGTWYGFSGNVELLVFATSVLWVVGLDQFLGEIFRPIPFDRVDPEYPLLAYAWNWMCALPHVVLRIPKANRIALRWRTRVKQAGKNPSLRTDYDWFRFEVLDLVFKPIGIIGSGIDASRAWRSTRRWLLLIVSLPFLLLLATVYCNAGLTLFKRKDVQTPIYATESLKLCSTKSLEMACQKRQESDFTQATGLTTLNLAGDGDQGISASTQRYVELLCKRILAAEPSNQLAKYRLGLILTLGDKNEEAEATMREIVDAKRGEFPQASSWLVKSLSIQRAAGKEISTQELVNHLEAACKWKEVDFRLLFLYGRMLLEQGDKTKAIEVTRNAVSLKPDYVLELARLYERIGDKAGMVAAANQAEDYFAAKINFPDEKEVDRLAVAEARILANRMDQAAEVLAEGVRLNLGGEKTVRQLSEIQGMIYRRSIRKLDDGSYELDLGLLETMADTDPQNPTVSSEIANLLGYKKKPSKKLLDILKKQIASGVISVPSLLVLGDGYYLSGRLKEAERFWGMAVEKDPNNYVVLNNLATCLVEISPSNAERALELVARANSLAPSNADVLDTWGWVLMNANRPKEAVNKLELVLSWDKGRLETRKKLKTVYETLGMTEMAELQSKMIKAMEESAAKNGDKQVLKPN